MRLYRLFCDLTGTERLVGWALRLGPIVLVLVFGHPPRGLWLHRKLWIEETPDRG